MKNPSKDTLEEWRTNPKYWKWKMFYYNKEDDRLLVDKPNPMLGTTLNFAHRKAYLFLLGILVFFGFIGLTLTRNP
ncbi:DUF5808 domain-containing protein [Flavobacterium sp.]|uniref:DUF5808 domain-containing protein n=1 Tax=Flavobacterium sp. TaxID=239 RepID=UPI002FDCC7B0